MKDQLSKDLMYSFGRAGENNLVLENLIEKNTILMTFTGINK